MKLFALSMFAAQVGLREVASAHDAGYVLTPTKDEATAWGLASIRKARPESNGWQGHNCIAIEIPEEICKKVTGEEQ
jgi:hypothetical protein